MTRHATFILLLATVFGAASGCSSIRTSSLPTTTANGAAPYAGVVAMVATYVPDGAQELGMIQASAHKEPLPEIAEAFKGEAARLGGNVAKLDRIAVTYEWVNQSRVESYSCGTQNAPRTCTRTVNYRVEVATTNLVGRAFRSVEVQP